MKTYAVHTKRVETQDLLDMLSAYPSPAEYDDFYLFARPHDNPTRPIVDMQTIEDEAEFDAAYQQLLTEEHTGRWVYLNEWQGRFLLNKYFSPAEDAGPLNGVLP